MSEKPSGGQQHSNIANGLSLEFELAQLEFEAAHDRQPPKPEDSSDVYSDVEQLITSRQSFDAAKAKLPNDYFSPLDDYLPESVAEQPEQPEDTSEEDESPRRSRFARLRDRLTPTGLYAWLNTLPAVVKEKWQRYEHKKGAKITAAVAALGIAAAGLYMLSKYGAAPSGQTGARAQEAFDGGGVPGGLGAHQIGQELGGNLPGSAGTAATIDSAAAFSPEQLAQTSTLVAKRGDTLWRIGQHLLENAGVHPDNSNINAVKDALVQSNSTLGPNHQIHVGQTINLQKALEVVARFKS